MGDFLPQQMQHVGMAQLEFRQDERQQFPIATENHALQVLVLKGGMIEQASAAHQEHTPPSRSGTRSGVGFIGGLYRTAE